jgi:plastocyanin
MKKLLILLVVVGALAFLWWSFKPEIEIEPAGNSLGAGIEINKNPIVIGGPAVAAKEVVYANNALAPAELRVKAGDRVIFRNNHVSVIRLSSDPHPIHTSFREFDSDTLQPGETYEFVFMKPMTLEYHNHFNPGVGGKIIVE